MKVTFKIRSFIVVMMLLILAFGFTTKNANEIEGIWFSKDLENSVIKVIKETNKDVWSAKIIKSTQPAYVGKTLFRNCVFNSTALNYSTIVTSPYMNTDIQATITINGPQMTIVGKKLFITKTFEWTRKE